MQSKTTVVISSLNRPTILHETVVALGRQTVSPGAILLSLCERNDALQKTVDLSLVRVVRGSKGLTKQRNSALRELPAATEYVLFLDDDIELAPNYVETMQRLLDGNHSLVASSGVTVLDGLRTGRALRREEAVEATLRYHRETRSENTESACGCNMFVRRTVLDDVRFDERLLLNGWLEDFDFSVRCRAHGNIAWNFETCVAHLAAQRLSRERGFPVGYSQIANSYYLWQKGVIPSFGNLVGRFWLPAMFGSLHGSIRGKPPWNKALDYKGRILGNARALLDAGCFKLRPERVLDFV